MVGRRRGLVATADAILRARRRAAIRDRAMNDITRILSDIEQGDAQAAERLLPLIYDELRKLAAQKMASEHS
jgi:hypothetical protein